MEDPSSPIDWDALNAELDGIDDEAGDGTRCDPHPSASPRLSSEDLDGDARSLRDQRDAREEGPSYWSDEELPRVATAPNMAVFKDILKDTLKQQTSASNVCNSKHPSVGNPSIGSADVEKFSLLRIKDRSVSSAELNSTFSGMRFVRLPAIKTEMMGGNCKESWATIGILVEKGMPKVSAKGKSYVAWKLGTLEKPPITILLFGSAYVEYWKEPLGSMLAVFNAGVRPDSKSKGPCLSVFNNDQLMKLGTSTDYSVCSGKRKDGSPCTMVLNRRLQGRFCQYHVKDAQQEFKTSRPELNGGKLIMVGPGIKRGYAPKPVVSPVKNEVFRKPLKHVTASELQDMLSDAEKMPSKSYSQGKRFLEVMAQRNDTAKQPARSVGKRPSSKKAAEREPGSARLAEAQTIVKSSRGAKNLSSPSSTSSDKGKAVVSEERMMTIDIPDDLDDVVPQLQIMTSRKRVRGAPILR